MDRVYLSERVAVFANGDGSYNVLDNTRAGRGIGIIRHAGDEYVGTTNFGRMFEGDKIGPVAEMLWIAAAGF